MASREPTFGEYLNQVRRSKGLSLRQAAKLIGTTHGRVDEIERMTDGHTGKPFVPSYVTVVRIAKAYGLAADDLLSRAGYEPWIDLNEDEKELLRGFRMLATERRSQLRITLNLLLEDQ